VTTYCKQSDAQETLAKSPKDSQKLSTKTDVFNDQPAWLLKQHQTSRNLTVKTSMSFLKQNQKEFKIFKEETYQL